MKQKGFGKKMFKYVIEKGKKENKKSIRLDVLKENIPAKKLYTKLGFNYISTIPIFYEDTGKADFMLYEYLL